MSLTHTFHLQGHFYFKMLSSFLRPSERTCVQGRWSLPATHTPYSRFFFHMPGASFRQPLCVTHVPGDKKEVFQSRSLGLLWDGRLGNL